MGINQTAVNVGGMIGASLLPIIAITLGWTYGFLFIGLSSLAICACVAILYKDPPPEVSPVAAENALSSTFNKPSGIRLMIDLFKSRDIWMLGLGGLFIVTVEFSTITYLVLYLNESLFFGVVAAGGLLAMTVAAGAFGKPASGFISDRLLGGRRKTTVILMNGITVIICFLLGIGINLGWFLYPLLIIFGMVAIGWGGLYATLAGELGGRESAGVASGTTGALTNLGVVIGPPLFGYIVDSTGSFNMAWFAMALCAGISMIFFSLVRENKRRA